MHPGLSVVGGEYASSLLSNHLSNHTTRRVTDHTHMHVDHTRLCPLSIDTLIPCGVRPRNHLPSSRRPMGCCSSKPDDSPSATTPAREVTSQRQPSPVAPPVERAPSRSAPRSRANSGHGSLPVDDVPMRERPRSNSTPQKRQPMTVDEDVPPVPSHSRHRAKSTHASSSRNTSTPVSAGESYHRWSA
jgi:hypothetical protein